MPFRVRGMIQKIVDLRPSLTHSSRSPDRKPATNKQSPKLTKKPLPLKTRRKRVRILIGVGGFIFFALTLYFLHWMSYRPAMRIQNVSVRGAMLQDPDDVAAFTREKLNDGKKYFIPRDNIFSYPKEELRAGIVRSFPRLQSVRLGRSGVFGTTLIVNVDERTAFATWCSDQGACYVFDDGGLIFAPTERSGKPELAYVFYGAIDQNAAIGSVFLPEKLRGVLDLLQRMREARFIPVSLRVLDEQDYTIALTNGFTIKASFGQEIDTIVHNLELVSVAPALRGKEAELEYIDLRFGNRVYYKFKGVEAPTEAVDEAQDEAQE